MAKKFWAVNRITEEKWKPERKGEYLVMYDSGYLAEVFHSDFYGMWVKPLNPKIWKVVHKFKQPEEKSPELTLEIFDAN